MDGGECSLCLLTCRCVFKGAGVCVCACGFFSRKYIYTIVIEKGGLTGAITHQLKRRRERVQLRYFQFLPRTLIFKSQELVVEIPPLSRPSVVISSRQSPLSLCFLSRYLAATAVLFLSALILEEWYWVQHLRSNTSKCVRLMHKSAITLWR